MRAEPSFDKSNKLQAELHRIVPGGAHTYARGSDQYPDDMAPIIARGSGAQVWDVDGNPYVEYGIGLRAVTLGHAYRPVIDAAYRAMCNGMSFSRPSELEVLAAQDFLGLVTTADMVKFGKNGSDATTAAVKLARAATGREVVAMCEQPFFSIDDWFIGRTQMSAGIPADFGSKSITFSYNDIDSLRTLFDQYPDGIAAVIMEAATATADPAPGFLEAVRALCDQYGAVLIFDEMITGFRWSKHGAQAMYRVTPDLSCWGKAMGNGFPISALAGKRDLMEFGGLNTDADRVFLMSTTHGPETASLAAFRAVVNAYRESDPVAEMERVGCLLADGVNAVVRERGLADYVQVLGRPSCLVFATRDSAGRPSQEYRTLFLQEIIRRGVLGQSFVVSAAHTDDQIAATIDAVSASLPVYEKAIEAGAVDGLLTGRPVAPALRRRAAPRRL